jgi:hypothetical protein
VGSYLELDEESWLCLKGNVGIYQELDEESCVLPGRKGAELPGTG